MAINVPTQNEFVASCIFCGSKLEPDDHTGHSPANQAIWYDGLVDSVMAGFGSKHDMDRYLITMCDRCIDDLKSSGRIVKYADLEDFLNSPETKKVQDRAREILKNDKGLLD